MGVIKGGVSLFSQNYFETVKEGWSVYNQFSIKDDSPGQLAWAFIVSAVMESVTGVFRESNVVSEDDEENLRKFVNDTIHELERLLTENEFYIDQQFYDYPEKFKLIDLFKPELKKYLTQIVTKHQAEALHNKLPFLFVSAVVNEWSKNPLKYKELLSWSKTPFDEALERELSWKQYHARLVEQTHTSIFQEAFSLASMYIPLRAYHKIIEKIENEKTENRIVCNIHESFADWVNGADRSDNLRFISGEPGCGKSSFSKMFAAEMTSDCSVLFVPLHHFESVGHLREDLNAYFEETSSLKEPLDLDSKLLLIFDGLDEYTMQGHSGKDQANEFVNKVRNYLNRNKSKDIKVIITGREIIMQNFEFRFDKHEHVYTLLPYLVNDVDRYTDTSDLLKIDQRQEWWKKYGEVIGEHYAGLPKNLVSYALDDLTARPLLNFLVARSYKSGNVQFSQETNLNEIYLDFIKSVYYREHGQNQKSIQGLEFEDFLGILQTLALGIWQGNGRTATMKHLAKRCEDNNLSEILCDFSENVEKGVFSVLTAFYSRKTNTLHQSQTFELTHKSFGEYLVAKQVVSVLQEIHRGLHQVHPKEKWKTKRALELWSETFGSQRIDMDLYPYIKNEIKINGPEKAQLWQSDLIRMIEARFEDGMPIEEIKVYDSNDDLKPIYRYEEMKRYAKNAEFALLLVLGMCAEICEIVSVVSWPNNISFGTWLREIVPQKSDYIFDSDQFLTHWLNLDDQNLSRLNMSKYSFVSLRRANLIGSDLGMAYLNEADLSEANLSGAYLAMADLKGANLKGANLSGAYLRSAYLNEANLSKANLSGVYLREQYQGAVALSGGYLSMADLNGAYLTTANLIRAKVCRSDIPKMEMLGIDISQIDIFDD